MKFKTFLEAKAEGSSKQVFEPIDHIHEFLKRHCSDSLWMIEQDKPFYRGFGKLQWDHPPAFVNLSKTARKSQNTNNFYTEIFDNHPEMQDFPKRSKSIICSTSKGYASAFGSVFAVIPVNGSKIGLVGEQDMWDLRTTLFGKSLSLIDANYFLKNLLDYDEEDESCLNALVKFDEALKTVNSEIIERLRFVEKYKRVISSDFLKELFDSYSPRKTGLLAKTTATLESSKIIQGEVWFDKGAVIINIDDWQDLQKHVKDYY
jgi:hypothetical protein